MAKKELCGRCNKPKGKTKNSCKCGRPPKFESPEQLEELIDAYFVWCDNHIEETPNLFYEEQLAEYEMKMKIYELAGGDAQFDNDDEEDEDYDEEAPRKGKKKKIKKIFKPIKPEKSHRRQVSSPYTVTGLCLWLGTTRDVLDDYQKKDEFSNSIKIAKLRCEGYYEKRLTDGTTPTGPIFALKNFGWKDKTEIEQNNTFSLTEEQKKAIEERLSVDE